MTPSWTRSNHNSFGPSNASRVCTCLLVTSFGRDMTGALLTVNTALGFQRRRLIPAPLPDTSSLGKKASAAGQWVDLPPMSGPLKEPFEIKVYEIDDVERLQRRRQEETTEVSEGGGQL